MLSSATEQKKVAVKNSNSSYDHIAEAIEIQENGPPSNSKERRDEEKMVTIDIESVHDNKLLCCSNPSPHKKQDSVDTLAIKKYFDQLENVEHDEYSAGYINFYELRVLLRIREKKPKFQNEFIKALDKEWRKYEKFAQETATKILTEPVSKQVMLKILKFNEFVWSNQQNFNHLILKHDAISPANKLETVWDSKLKYAPQNILFPAIKQMPSLYDEIDDEQINKINNSNPHKNVAQNIKYWVHNSDIFEVIGMITQRVPIYIDEKKEENESVYDKISSVYFDNDDFECYETGKCLRIRWYGNNDPQPAETVHFERKHAECDKVAETERFCMKNAEIISFINDGNDGTGNVQLQTEVFEMIKTLNLKPKTRTVFKRIVFQFASSDSLVISLDLNLKFIKEKDNLLNSQWFTRFADISDDEMSDYPMCVLEIKLSQQNANNPPKWIQDLMDSKLLMECNQFSKYSECVNLFYQNKKRGTPKWRSINKSEDIQSNKKAINRRVYICIGICCFLSIIMCCFYFL